MMPGRLTTSTLSHAQDWTLDSVGNWSTFKQAEGPPGWNADGNGTFELNQPRLHNKANEITRIDGADSPDPVSALLTPSPAGAVDPVHDRAGNMTKMPKPDNVNQAFTASYDAWNRLVKLADGANTVAEYQYDARGRRIVKKPYTSGTLSETRHFYYSNAWQVLEERIGTSTNANTQYVWGLGYVDELVARYRDTNNDGATDETLYAIQDANYNLTALSDIAGSIVERFRYTPYGQRTVLDSNFALDADGISDYGFSPGHQGLMHDSESGLIENRNRVLHVTLGRFVQRDPMEYVDGMGLYQYVKSNVSYYVDPSGNAAETPWDVFNVSSGAISLGCNIASGNVIGSLVDAGGLIYDAAAVGIPGLPGGASTVIKLYRSSKLARRMYNALEASKTAMNVYRFGVRQGVDAAHHIVPLAAKATETARKKLKKLGIDLNDALNGAALPMEFHHHLHTKAYYQMIEFEASKWILKLDAVVGLNEIAWRLLKQSGKVK